MLKAGILNISIERGFLTASYGGGSQRLAVKSTELRQTAEASDTKSRCRCLQLNRMNPR
jgi:hypothetical protein